VRDRIDGLIDISPFGCRTGFHVIMWGEPDVASLVDAISDSLRAIAEDVQWDDVPGADAYSCGNYRDHSLHSAREWSKAVLEKGISRDAFARVGV
jgi:S-ribosylhomocysteine lyase